MDVVLNVPVRRFVFKYIRAKYNLAPGMPWRVATRGKESIAIYGLLERAPNRYEQYKKNEVILQIKIPSWLLKEKGCFLSQKSIELFTNFIQDEIIDEITMYYFGVKNGIGLKRSEKVVTTVFRSKDDTERTRRIPTSQGSRFFAQDATIYDILKKYDITEEDLTFASVVKHLQRSALAS
jgi:hypothetical protein